MKKLSFLIALLLVFSLTSCDLLQTSSGGSLGAVTLPATKAPTTTGTPQTDPSFPSSTQPPVSTQAPLSTQPPVNPPVEPDKDVLQIISIEMSDMYGDATIIKYGDYEVLIDAGKPSDSSTVKRTLDAYCEDDVLELFIATHAHDDHIGGINTNNFFRDANVDTVEMIVDFGYTYTTAAYRRYVSARNSLVSAGTQYEPIKDLMAKGRQAAIFYLNDEQTVWLEFLNTGNYQTPGASASGDINATSIACAVHYGNVKILLTGDLTSSKESDLVSNIKKLDPNYFTQSNIVIYKGAHHGSNGSNSSTLLSYIKPDYVFVSAAIVSENRTTSGPTSNQHPYDGAINRMKSYTSAIYWNGINGTTVFTIEENTVTVQGMGRTINYYYRGTVVDPASEKNTPYLQSKWWAA